VSASSASGAATVSTPVLDGRLSVPLKISVLRLRNALSGLAAVLADMVAAVAPLSTATTDALLLDIGVIARSTVSLPSASREEPSELLARILSPPPSTLAPAGVAAAAAPRRDPLVPLGQCVVSSRSSSAVSASRLAIVYRVRREVDASWRALASTYAKKRRPWWARPELSRVAGVAHSPESRG
jgi:hypothetical protein